MQTETNPETLRETVKLLFYQGLKTRVISEETGVKPATIKTWINRFKWNRTVSEANGIREARAAVNGAGEVAVSMSARSAQLRSELADEIQNQLAVLRRNPVKPGEIGNSGEGRASIVKRLAETACLVHNWAAENTPGIVVVRDMILTAPEDLAVANEDLAVANSVEVETVNSERANSLAHSIE